MKSKHQLQVEKLRARNTRLGYEHAKLHSAYKRTKSANRKQHLEEQMHRLSERLHAIAAQLSATPEDSLAFDFYRPLCQSHSMPECFVTNGNQTRVDVDRVGSLPTLFPHITALTIVVCREEVEAGDVLGCSRVFEQIGRSESASLRLIGSVVLLIEGYDDDPREIWEIEEPRAWYHELIAKVPHVLYFLSVEHDAIGVLLQMACGPYPRATKPDEKLRKFFANTFEAINRFTASLEIDPNCEQLTAFWDRVCEHHLPPA